MLSVQQSVSACHRWRAGLSESVELRTGKRAKLKMTEIRVTEKRVRLTWQEMKVLKLRPLNTKVNGEF